MFSSLQKNRCSSMHRESEMSMWLMVGSRSCRPGRYRTKICLQSFTRTTADQFYDELEEPVYGSFRLSNLQSALHSHRSSETSGHDTLGTVTVFNTVFNSSSVYSGAPLPKPSSTTTSNAALRRYTRGETQDKAVATVETSLKKETRNILTTLSHNKNADTV